MEIKASQLRNGLEVDSFFGKINVNRGRYTLKFDSEAKEYMVIKVTFALIQQPEKTETIFKSTDFLRTLHTYNMLSKESDKGIND